MFIFRLPAILAFGLILFFPYSGFSQTKEFSVINEEIQEKGRKPSTIKPSENYKLLVLKAALKNEASLSKEKIEAITKELLMNAREMMKKAYKADAATVYLFQSEEHLKSGSIAIGRGEWWPKGHDLSTENAKNINDEATYEEVIAVIFVPSETEDAVSRIPDKTRRQIFKSYCQAENKATDEASEKYPDNRELMGLEIERLDKKYKGKVQKEYKLSKSELERIAKEGGAKNWPAPE